MSRVRSTNTSTELVVRSLVHRLGYRFRLHYKKLPGKPDLAFPARRKVIFVHGCFWHGHEGCSKGKLPKSNLDTWDLKISTNRSRDKAQIGAVINLGWQTLVIWQCELKDTEQLKAKILHFLKD
jgi:DNA mismatch endonuclease, patch repair protein